jgi:hypothetical protein
MAAGDLALTLARAASTAAFAYLGAGLVCALHLFLRGGLARLDPATRTSTLPFKWTIVPGAVALWPLLLRRLRQTGAPR